MRLNILKEFLLATKCFELRIYIAIFNGFFFVRRKVDSSVVISLFDAMHTIRKHAWDQIITSLIRNKTVKGKVDDKMIDWFYKATRDACPL